MTVIPRHFGSRPSWTCRDCHQPYPCRPAQQRLVAVHRETGRLGEVAAKMLELAVRDGYAASQEQLWEQFIAWTEPTWVAWPSWAA